MKKKLFSLSIVVLVASIIISGTTSVFSDSETSTGNTFQAGAIDLMIDNTSYFNGLFNEDTSWLQANLDEGQLFFNFRNIKPGDYGEDTISLHVNNNDAWLCVDVTLTSNDDNGLTEPEEQGGDVTPGVGEGELADIVNFIWWADDGDSVLEVDENLLPSGTLGHLDVGSTTTIPLADSNNNIWNGSGPLQGNVTYYIGKAWCFGDIVVNPLEQDGQGFLGAEGFNGPDVRGAGFSCEVIPFDNSAQSDSMTANISFLAVQARHNGEFECSVPPPPCEECKGGVTFLELKYNGEEADVKIVEKKSGTIVFEGHLQSGDVFSFVGSKDENKFDNTIKIFLDEEEHVSIHTSCSQPIGPGLIFGDFEIVSADSRDNGLICPLPPPPPCEECKGGVTFLELQYNGAEEMDVKVVEKKDNIVVFEGHLQPGDVFSFVGSKDENKFDNTIKIFLDEEEHVSIHTSCSQPIGPGLIFGDFEVISADSKKNGPICPLSPE